MGREHCLAHPVSIPMTISCTNVDLELSSVKFLHLSDGTPHKRACPDVKDIELPIHSDCNELQIRGPLIGLSTDKQMIIIDWTTGAKEVCPVLSLTTCSLTVIEEP